MKEVLRTNDPVKISYAVAILKEAGCHPFVADRFMASAEGGISALQRRVMVPDDQESRAKLTLKAIEDGAPQQPLPDDFDVGEPEDM